MNLIFSYIYKIVINIECINVINVLGILFSTFVLILSENNSLQTLLVYLT